MGKQADVFQTLLQETPAEVLELVEKIQQLKNTIQTKRSRVEQLGLEIEEKRQKVKELLTESREALANGSDPGRNAGQVQTLKAEIELLQDLMPSSSHSDTAAKERKDLEQLQRDLTGKLRTFVQGSDTRKRLEEHFNDVAALMVKTRKEWEAAVEKLHHHFETSTSSVIYTLHIKDKVVARDVAWHFGRST